MLENSFDSQGIQKIWFHYQAFHFRTNFSFSQYLNFDIIVYEAS